jgi:hypothetical protein
MLAPVFDLFLESSPQAFGVGWSKGQNNLKFGLCFILPVTLQQAFDEEESALDVRGVIAQESLTGGGRTLPVALHGQLLGNLKTIARGPRIDG